jgi:protein-disulfide isomerase
VPTVRDQRRLRTLLVAAGVAVLAFALLAVGALQLLPRNAATGPTGPTKPGATTAAGILVPLNGTPTNVAFGRTLGRPDAPVRLIVWSDFQCADCKAFAQETLPQLIARYVSGGRLRIEFRDLAVVGPESSAAAAAARCADQQDKFWPYHDVLFANQAAENSGQLGPKRLKDMADAVGVDRTKFDVCLPAGDLFNAISAETKQGQARGSGDPVLDFGSVVLEGSPPVAQLTQTIDTLLANAPTPAPSASAGASGASASP